MKRTWYNIFFSLIYYAINLATNFGITSLLITSLGDETYSFYPLANSISGWLVIASIAVNSMLSRHISISVNKGDTEEAAQYYSTAIYANKILTAILLIPIIVIPMFADMILTVPIDSNCEIKILIFFVLLTVPVNMIESVLSISATAKDQLHLEYIGRIFQTLIKFLIIFFTYYVGIVNLFYVGIAIFCSDVFLLVWMFRIKSRLMPEIVYERNRFDRKLLRHIISSGTWNSITQLGNSLLFQFDLIMSNVMLGLSAAGSISIALNIPSAVTSLTTMLGSVFMPDFYKEYALNKFSKRYIHRLQNSQMLSGGIIGTLVVIVLFYGKEFFDLWVPNNNSNLLLRLSFFYLIPLVFTSMFRGVSNSLIVLNKMKIQAVLTVINGALNVISMFILIRVTNFGIYSVVTTTAVITLVWNILFIPIYVSQNIGCNIRELYKAPVATVLMLMIDIFICRIGHTFLPVDLSWWNFIMNVGTVAVLCYGFFFIVAFAFLRRKG